MVCPVLGVVYGFMKWNPALTQITEDMDSCVGLSFHFWKTSAGHNHRQGATATVARAMSLRTARPAGAVTSAVSVLTPAVAETSAESPVRVESMSGLVMSARPAGAVTLAVSGSRRRRWRRHQTVVDSHACMQMRNPGARTPSGADSHHGWGFRAGNRGGERALFWGEGVCSFVRGRWF